MGELEAFELAQGFIEDYGSGSCEVQAPHVGGGHGYAVESVSVTVPQLLRKSTNNIYVSAPSAPSP